MYGIISIPILIYIYNIYAYALNLPDMDDFDAVLAIPGTF